MFTFRAFTISLAFLCCVCAKTCFSGNCRCYEKLKLIDCTRVGLYTIPQPELTLRNYTSLLLRHNHLKQFNFSVLVSLLPRVVIIDLRDNNPLLCGYLLRFKPPNSIKIISDCDLPTTNDSVTQPTKPSTWPDLFSSTSTSIISRYPTTSQHPTSHILKRESSTSEHSNQDIVYYYVLITSILILPATIIIIRLIIRCWRLRRQPRNQPVLLQLSPLSEDGADDSDDDNVIFMQGTTEL